MNQFNESNTVDSISVIEEGQHAGKVKVTVAKSPFITREIVVDQADLQRVITHQESPFAQIVANKGFDVNAGTTFDSPQGLTLSKDAFIDSEGLDWILSQNDGSEVDALFTDLVHSRAKAVAAGASFKSINDLDSNFGSLAQEQKVQSHIADQTQSQNLLEDLRSQYGQDGLEKMSDREFYELYKSQV